MVVVDQKGVSLKVHKRCLVQFSIGKQHQDEVWCDVVPMDACRPLSAPVKKSDDISMDVSYTKKHENLWSVC